MMVPAVRIWILCSALLVSTGWILSALHELNRVGYATAFVIGAGIGFVLRRWILPQGGRLRPGWRRFRRLAPLLFLVLAWLSLLSGLWYAGLNWDANAYRLPRIMHWLGAGQWHWIHSADARMNVSGCGFEWLAAPLILFTGTDRLLFLINWIAYLLLPGLVFSVFTRLQVRPRVAWWWMWFFPAGWCFALQAGSIANDSFAAVYILAAVDLALRAQKENRAADFWLSLLAVALATGVKQTNIPLVLLWVAAAGPGWRFFRLQPMVATGVTCLGALVSIIPTSLANLYYTGSPLPMEYAGLGNFKLNPFWGIVGNAMAIPAQNLLPPFYHLLPPFTINWDAVCADLQNSFLHSSFGQHFSTFEHFLVLSHGTGITEENASLGLGVCVLLLAGAGEAWRRRILERPVSFNRQLWWLRVLPWGLLLIFMATVGSYQNGRQLAPYYPFLLLALLVQPGQVRAVRQRQWQWLGHAVMILTAVMIFASVDRPLFPASDVCKWLRSRCPESDIIWMEGEIYRGSSFRALEARRKVVQQMRPPNEPVLGFYANYNMEDEFAAWWPMDGRRVERVSPGDSPESLAARGIHSVIVSDWVLKDTGETPADWAKTFHAALAGKFGPDPRTDPGHAGYVFYLFRVGLGRQPSVF